MFLQSSTISLFKQFCVCSLLFVITCLNSAIALENSDDKPWIDFRQAEGAFSIKLPVKPEYMLKESKNPLDTLTSYKLNLYLASDEVNHTNYVVRYNDFPPGTFLINKAEVFDIAVKDLEAKGKLVYGPEPVKTGNYDGIEVRLMLENRYTICRMFLRGNRFYLLLKQNALEKIMVSLPDEFFSSFKLEPYQTPKFITHQPAGESFKVKLFDKPYVTKDNEVDHSSFISNSTSLYTNNPNSGGSYILEYSNIKDYYRIKSIDSLLKQFETNLIKENDTLISSKNIKVNEQVGREFLMLNKTSGNMCRTKMWIDGDKLIFMRSFSTDEEISSPVADGIFSSYINKPGAFKFSTSKAQKITNDLSSSDTSVLHAASGALNYYEFSKDELPVIYSALQKTYPDDQAENSTRVRLIELLETVNDNKTIAELQSLYKKAEGLDEIRESILYTIANTNQPTSYNTYLDMLTTEPLINKKSLSYKVFSPLDDSLSFAAANFERLKPLLQHSAYREDILDLAGRLVYSEDSLYVNLVKSNYNTLTTYALKDAEEYLAIDSITHQPIYSYLTLMDDNKGALADSFTEKILSKPDKWPSNRALAIRIKHGFTVNDNLIKIKLDSLSTRYMAMEALSKANQLHKVPQKYKQQDEFSRLCLYEALTDEDYYPEKIELLGKITEQDSIYYIFNIFYKQDDKIVEYLGIGGPHSPSNTQLDFDRYNAYAPGEETRKDWEAQAREIIRKEEE